MRLHGVWRRPGLPETWHGAFPSRNLALPIPPRTDFPCLFFCCARLELGRPQIHGYPIASVAFTNRLQFVSGADEKIVRVFDAPKIFVATLKELSGLDLGDEVRLYRYLFFLLFLLGV